MASKKRKAKRKGNPPRRPPPELMAEILSVADRSSPGAAATQFGVSERSIWRWRAEVKAGKLPEVAELVSGLKAGALEECQDLLNEVYRSALEQMKAKLPAASYRELLDTVVETGGLKAFRDAMNEDAGGTDSGSSAGRQAGSGSGASYPGGAGVQKTLRVVG